MMRHPIRRRFADVAHGQIHYRTAGNGAPLLMIHASPGSSKQMLRIIGDFADLAQVFAPDTPGNGDSDALPIESPTINDLAQAYLALIDRLDLARVKLYGSHTGAAIASELAIMAPDRVERLVLDGVQVLTPDARTEMIARYAFPFPPDLDGAHLMRVFQFCRDQYLFFPWYDRTRQGQREGGLPSPHDLHHWVVEVLKASETYHLNYRAAFQWRPRERLPLIDCPVLVVAAANDPLMQESRDVTPVIRESRYIGLPRFDAADYAAARKAALATFFALD